MTFLICVVCIHSSPCKYETVTNMSSWCSAPNFVIISIGQFLYNADIRAYALNVHWYGIFKRCISCFPYLLANLRSTTPLQSTEYLVTRGQLYIEHERED